MNQIVGMSGSGKSVLTKCMVGLHRPEGRVLQRPLLHDMNDEEKRGIRQEIGMLFQSSALFDSLTVLANVMFPLKMFARGSEEEMRERARFCLDRVNIVDKKDICSSQIGGGMQKRVGIARAIAMEPKCLFCDEPNSGLDPQDAILIDDRSKTEGTTPPRCVVTRHELGDGDRRTSSFTRGRKWWWEAGRNC